MSAQPSKTPCSEDCLCKSLDPAWPTGGGNLTEICIDETPGLKRRRCGRGFTFRTQNGETLRCKQAKRWLKALAIPPQWENVWVCTNANGHVLVRGEDAQGRYQYIYHPRWIARQRAEKFDSLIGFGKALPAIRAAYQRGMSKRTIKGRAALALALIDHTAMRVGSARAAQRHGSFGAVTLQARHVSAKGQSLQIIYKGKGGKRHARRVTDQKIAQQLKRTGLHLETKQLLRPPARRLTAGDVRRYLANLYDDASPKDFRTWHASVEAFSVLWDEGGDVCGTNGAVSKSLKRAAQTLGNTEAICRTSYVHPHIIKVLKGECAAGTLRQPGRSMSGLSKLESDFLRWLSDTN